MSISATGTTRSNSAVALACGWAFARSTASTKTGRGRSSDNRGYGYASFAEFMRRSELPKKALMTLAEADGLRSFGMDRREALWAVRRLPDQHTLPLFEAQRMKELPTEHISPLPEMPLSEHVLADYQTLRLSLKGYPMQFLRELFTAEKVKSCAEVEATDDGRRVRCAGVILVRQMPGDAGVVFITLSDETGITNVVVWPSAGREHSAARSWARGCCWWKARCRKARVLCTRGRTRLRPYPRTGSAVGRHVAPLPGQARGFGLSATGFPQRPPSAAGAHPAQVAGFSLGHDGSIRFHSGAKHRLVMNKLRGLDWPHLVPIAACVILAAPLWCVASPPMPDYPAHLASFYLINGGASQYLSSPMGIPAEPCRRSGRALARQIPSA